MLIIFLFLPKISITESFGLLLGELVLISYTLRYLLYGYVKVNKIVLPYILFNFCFFIVSSVYVITFYQIFSIISLIYFLRILIYLTIFLYVARLAKHMSEVDIMKRLVVFPILICWSLSFLVFSINFLLKTPSLSDMLWGYEVGLRLIPIFGLTIDQFQPTFLRANSASGVVLCSLMVFSFLITHNVYQLRKYRTLFLVIMIITPVLTLSRSGFAAVILAIIITFFPINAKKGTLSLKSLGVFFTSFFLLIFIDTWLEINLGVSIQGRIIGSIETGNLSTGRFERIHAIFNVYSESTLNAIFGLSNDIFLRHELTGYKHSESLVFDIIQGGGIISVFTFTLYIFSLVKLASKFNYFSILLKFYCCQFPVTYLIGGGDFHSPAIMYMTMICFGLGSYEKYIADRKVLSS